MATAADVAKYLLAGADVVMTASALLRHGPGYAGVLPDELSAWMARKGFRSVAEVRGLLAAPLVTLTQGKAGGEASRPPAFSGGTPVDGHRRSGVVNLRIAARRPWLQGRKSLLAAHLAPPTAWNSLMPALGVIGHG